MSRANKKALGKQWNRSGEGKKFSAPRRNRMLRISQRRPEIADKDWLDAARCDADTREDSTKECMFNYVFGDDVDSATNAIETEPEAEDHWRTKLTEIHSEPNAVFRRVCSETMSLQTASGSDIGCCREKNEDAVFVDEEFGLFIVCDGMGGHLAGEVASQKAVEYTVNFLVEARSRRILPEVTDTDFREVWADLMAEALQHCCNKVLEFAQTNPELDGMATTITAVMIVDGYAFVGHLGDSRLYLCNGNVVKQLTTDHTLLNDILRTYPEYLDSGNDPAALNRFKHVLTRCVGRDDHEFAPDSFSFPLVEDDVLLLCSDGLSNYFDSESQLAGLLRFEDSIATVETLIGFAKSGGGSDNISAVVIRVSGSPHASCCSQNSEADEFDPLSDTQEFKPKAATQ